MNQKNNPGQAIIRNIGLALLAGTVIWIIALIVAASLFNSTKTGSYDIAIGPLVLNTLTRHATGNAYTVSVSLGSGLFIYYIIWAIAGLLMSLRGLPKKNTG